MNKNILINVLLLLIGVFFGYLIFNSTTSNNTHGIFLSNNKIDEIITIIKSQYVEKTEDSVLLENAYSGLLNNLDPHSFYISKGEMANVEEEMQGSFEGIGIEFNILEDTLFVVAPIAGGPSQKAGIFSGDRIIKVGDKNIAGVGLSNIEVMRLLKGEKGTKVKIYVKRSGYNELLPFTLTRDEIPLYSIDYSYLISPGTGYIKINRFSETTYQEFCTQLDSLKEIGMKNLILDLRNNPGGYMKMAELISDELLSKNKVIVTTKGRLEESNSEFVSSAKLNRFEKGALIILIDQGSASASEILAGAVQDWDRGLIIGNRSFGKGLVQNQVSLSDGSAIRFVVSRYYTPSGRCIQKPYSDGKKVYENDILSRYESGEMFDTSNIKFPDSLKFKTKKGRIVFGSGGIFPDYFIPKDTSGFSTFYSEVFLNNLFRQFAVRKSESDLGLQLKKVSPNEYCKTFTVNESLFNEFISFCNVKKVKEKFDGKKSTKELIKQQIKANLGRQLFGDSGYYPVLLLEDKCITKALTLIPEATKMALEY